MFLETEKRPQGEPAKVGALKPSEAIRRGHPLTDEYRVSHYYCALGAMWRGYGKTDDELHPIVKKSEGNLAELMGEAMGLPPGMAKQIEAKHLFERMPRIKIADWLEERGY